MAVGGNKSRITREWGFDHDKGLKLNGFSSEECLYVFEIIYNEKGIDN